MVGVGFNLGHLEPTLVKKRHNIFQVGSWRKDEWKPHGEPKKILTHQLGGRVGGVEYRFKSFCDFCPSRLNCFHTLW